MYFSLGLGLGLLFIPVVFVFFVFFIGFIVFMVFIVFWGFLFELTGFCGLRGDLDDRVDLDPLEPMELFEGDRIIILILYLIYTANLKKKACREIRVYVCSKPPIFKITLLVFKYSVWNTNGRMSCSNPPRKNLHRGRFMYSR